MDLWIRSQDRLAFTIVERLRIIRTEKKRFVIVNYDSAEMLQELGEYSTEERAIEVLDEIAQILTPIQKTTELKNNVKYVDKKPVDILIPEECYKLKEIQFSYYLYEMPKE